MFNRLAVVLEEKKISKTALAASLGVTLSTVGRWCNNYTQPSLEALYLISEFLKVQIGSLQYIVPKTFRLKKDIRLSVLDVNDALLYTVQGKSTLFNIQNGYFQVNTIFPTGRRVSYPLDLNSFVELNQNPKVPLIEIAEEIYDCRDTILTIENCNEEITVTFLCQDNTN